MTKKFILNGNISKDVTQVEFQKPDFLDNSKKLRTKVILKITLPEAKFDSKNKI